MAFIPLYRQIAERILQAIQDGELTQFPTEAALMKQYQVSRVTVRNALQLLKDDHLIQAHAGKATIIQARSVAAITSHAQANIIGLVMAGVSDNYGLILLQTIQEYAWTLGYFVIIRFSQQSPHDEARQIKTLIKFGVAGILVFPVENHGRNTELLMTDIKVPLVVLDRQLGDLELPIVGTDNYNSIKVITELLFKMGHTNITFILQKHSKNTAMQARVKGIMAAYKAHNMQIRRDAWLYWETPANQTKHYYRKYHQAIAGISGRLLNKKDYTCYMALDFASVNAFLIARTLIESKLPKKISFLGFDGPPYMTTDNRYNRIVQDEVGIAHQALDLLEQLIQGKTDISQKIFIEPKYLDNYSVFPE